MRMEVTCVNYEENRPGAGGIPELAGASGDAFEPSDEAFEIPGDVFESDGGSGEDVGPDAPLEDDAAPAEERKTKSSAGMRLLKILYFVVFGVSLFIVGLYLYLTFGVRAPEVEDPPVSSPPTVEDQPGSPTGSGPSDTGGTGQVQTPALERRKEVYTCLIFGMDDGYGNTDTIMVATFDVPAGKIGLVSIPRDTIVSQNYSAANNKVNAAYARGGVEELEAEVEELLGIPIDFYVKIRLSAFERLVNNVGGVYFDVPEDMNYDDPAQNLSIHLSAGYQLLNGEQAMGLVRFRQDNSGVGYGDVGRAQTQQAFLKAMLSQVLAGASLETIPDLIDILVNYVETDAGFNDMLYFGRELVGMELDGAISTATLPSAWHSPYMWVESEAALATVNDLLNPYTTPVTESMAEFFTR